jgi:hypothetical protein
MKDVEDRNAHFTTAIAFADSDGIRVFWNDRWQNRDKTRESRVRARPDLSKSGAGHLPRSRLERKTEYLTGRWLLPHSGNGSCGNMYLYAHDTNG